MSLYGKNFFSETFLTSLSLEISFLLLSACYTILDLLSTLEQESSSILESSDNKIIDVYRTEAFKINWTVGYC